MRRTLAVKHDRSHLNVETALYPLWVNSLLACVEKYDPKCDAALRRIWNEVLDVGIRVMKQAY